MSVDQQTLFSESAKRFTALVTNHAPMCLITDEAAILTTQIMRIINATANRDVATLAKEWLKEMEAGRCTCGKDACWFSCGYCLAKGVAAGEKGAGK